MTNTRPMRIVIVALAAGASRRFGPEDKLLADIDGRPMVIATLARLAAGADLAARRGIVSQAVAVVADPAGPVAAAIRASHSAVAIAANPRATEGIGTSIAAGVAAACALKEPRARGCAPLALPRQGQAPGPFWGHDKQRKKLVGPGGCASRSGCGAEAPRAKRLPTNPSPDGILISPADMPRLAPATIARLLLAFARHRGRYPAQCVMADGTPTSPVIWPRTMFRRLRGLSGDRGGRGLLAGLRTIPVVIGSDEGCDVDRPGDLPTKR